MSKKQVILEAALTLFSERGFDGVSVDEIADAVGIKGPALYYYFKGKDALLDGIIESVEVHYSAEFGNANNITYYPKTMEEFMELSLKRLMFTIHDDMVIKVRKLLAIEQFRNDKLRTLATNHQLTGLIDLNSAYLQKLMDDGQVVKCDPKVLALQLTAPLTLVINWIDRSPEREAEAVEIMKKHIELFGKTYKLA